MKKLLTLCAMLAVVLTSCAQQKAKTAARKASSEVLVAYFSATGTTEGVARVIASGIGAPLFRITPLRPYSEADLDWRNDKSRSSLEAADRSARPAMKTLVRSVGKYRIVFLGYPIWWNEAPRIINTFVEKEGLKGVTVIPFATSGGSGIDYSVRQLKAAYPAVGWREGRLLNAETDKEIQAWAKQALAAAKK